MKKIIKKQRYISIGRKWIPVTEEVYLAYKRPEWREAKRLEERENSEISYDLMLENGIDVEYDNPNRTDDIAIKNIYLEEFWNIFKNFTDEEKNLIYELYFKDKTHTNIGSEFNITQQALSLRKKRLLIKCKEILNSDKFAQILEFFGC